MRILLRFILSFLAFWGFTSIGWVTIASGASFFWSVILMSIVGFIIDFFMLLAEAGLNLFLLPAVLMTDGYLSIVIKATVKYFSLYLAAGATGFFVLPWIFGPDWYQCLVIGLVFALIARVGNSSRRFRQFRRSRSRSR